VNECMHDDYGEEVKDRFGITNGACPSPFSNCVNTEGSYYCQCKPNFLDVYGNATLCTAQFCEAGLDNCDDNAACISAVGSFACACNTGYASRSQVGGGSAKQAPGTSGDCVAVGACERGDDFHADCVDPSTRCISELHLLDRQTLDVVDAGAGTWSINGSVTNGSKVWVDQDDPGPTSDNCTGIYNKGWRTSDPSPFHSTKAYQMNSTLATSNTFECGMQGPLKFLLGQPTLLHMFTRTPINLLQRS